MKRKDGFTLIELLVVLVIIAILVAIQIPALAKATQQTKAALCMNNCRQLMIAWLGYTRDSNDNIVYALHGAGAQGGAGFSLNGQLVHGWASGWLDWSTATDNTNSIFLTNSRYALLAPYLSGSKYVFKCPADNFLSAAQRARGWSDGRSRSISGDIFLGNGNAFAGPIGAIYRQCIKVSDLQRPSPGETWAFTEEHPDSINDPEFFPPQNATLLTDVPGTLHNSACNFAFCDGHAAINKWKGCLSGGRALQVLAIDGNYLNNAIGAAANDPDVYYLSYHSPRKAGAAGTPY